MKMQMIMVVFFIGALNGAVESARETVGQLFDTTKTLDGVKGALLLEDILLRTGVVYQIKLRAVSRTPVRIQIWRPVDMGLKQYRLIDEHRFVPDKIPKLYTLDFVYKHELMYTQYGDVIGIFNEEPVSAVGYRMTPSRVFHYTPPDGATIDKNAVVEFESIELPYQFSLEVSYDTNQEAYATAPDGGGTKPTTPTTPQPPTIPSYPENRGTFLYAGNSLQDRGGIKDQSPLGVFLLHNVKLRKGIVTEFYGYFWRVNPVWLQVFRPTKYEDVFQLVGQVLYYPQDVPRAIRVQLSREDYMFVEDNDIIGFTNEYRDGSVAYSFDTMGSIQMVGPYSAPLPAGGMPKVGDAITVNMVGMPYNFAIGAMYDAAADLSNYGNAPTMPDIKSSTVAPSTTPSTPGTPPSQFKDEKNVLGGDFLKGVTSFVQGGAKKTFLMSDLLFEQDAILTSFWGYFVSSGSMHFQVWREVPDTTNMFRLIGQKSHTATNVGFQEVKVEDGIVVRKGDCLGFRNDNETGILGHSFEAVSLYYTDQGAAVVRGDVLEFDKLFFPYKFSIAATYTLENVPPPSVTQLPPLKAEDIPDPSTTHSSGIKTTTNKTPNGLQPVTGKDSFSWLDNPDFLLGMFIWLCVLTFLFIVMCILLCCRRCRKREEIDRRYFAHAYAASHGRPPSAYNTMSNMKDDQSIDYFNPTIGNTSMRGAPPSGPPNGRGSPRKQGKQGDGYTRM